MKKTYAVEVVVAAKSGLIQKLTVSIYISPFVGMVRPVDMATVS